MIANNVKGGINEIINNNNGVMFNNTSEDLAKNIDTVLQYKYNKEDIRSDAIIRFNMDTIANKYTFFFKKLS